MFVVLCVVATDLESQEDVLHKLTQLGFVVAEPWTACAADEVMGLCLQREMSRKGSDFDMDGAVVKVNSHSVQRLMGEGRKYPKWAMAYKFGAEEAETELLDITMQV